MNENFENLQENESFMLQPDDTLEPEIKNIDESVEDFAIDEIAEPKITIPDIYPTSDKKINVGVKTFCIILATVLLLSVCSVGGYFFGRHSVLNNNLSFNSEIELNNKPADTNALSASEIYANVSKSVVGILVYNENGVAGEASGVVYSEDGLILTNDHIYASTPSAKFKIFMHDGTEYDAYYLAGDTRSDLALLKISDSVKLSVPEFGNSEEVVTGENVCVIGRPNGYSSKSTLTLGIVSVPKVRMAVTTSYTSNFIQTDAAINPGNSGGAMVNSYGQIIGITACKLVSANYEGVGYAIPTKTVQKIAASLSEHGNVKNRAKLGISYYAVNRAEAEISGISSCGLIVDSVTSESSLFGRLNKGDIITHINGTQIIDDVIVLDILEESLPGQSISLTVIRENGKTETMEAVLLNDEGSSSYVISSGINKQY